MVNVVATATNDVGIGLHLFSSFQGSFSLAKTFNSSLHEGTLRNKSLLAQRDAKSKVEMSEHVWDTAEWKALAAHAPAAAALQLPALLAERSLTAAFETWTLDYSRQLVTAETLALLHALARRVDLQGRIRAMARGDRINTTENRSVLHTALRCAAGDSLVVDGRDVCADVRSVQAQIRAYAARVRSGEHKGATGKRLRNIVSIGIGGSYLGVEFAYEALRHDAAAKAAAEGLTLRFLANVDPTDSARALEVRGAGSGRSAARPQNLTLLTRTLRHFFFPACRASTPRRRSW
jgi:hypothetical protein